MMLTSQQENRRQLITDIASSMSREAIAWAFKFLTNCMMASNVSNPAVDNEKHPSWWNMPITEATKSLMPKVRQDLGDDYKEELTDILEKRFHKILCGYSFNHELH